MDLRDPARGGPPDTATVTQTPRNPLGAKGIGGAATIGSTPAVVNAVVDALGGRHVDMPRRGRRGCRGRPFGAQAHAPGGSVG